MMFLPRQKIYLATATALFLFHLVIAAAAKPSFPLSLYGHAMPCVLLLLAILAARENFRCSSGTLSLFWKLFACGSAILLLSKAYWLYFDWRRLSSSPSPVAGDSLFLLGHVFFLTALALRPHSASAGRDLRIRSLDLVLLSLWWLSLYGHFSLPWQVLHRDFPHYNHAYYVLALIQHLVIIAALVAFSLRNTSLWRAFYLQLLAAFVLIAAGNLLLNVAVDKGTYYAGSYFDSPFLLAICLFTFMAGFGSALQPRKDSIANRELIHSVWTARLAMLGILSLPLIALLGLYQANLPPDVANFRLRLVFGAMFLLGALVYWKLNLLTRELGHLLRLTGDSIENLQAVQHQVAHSEKLIALGRLAAGAAHEISNPLTAIFGYSDLLTDIASLSPEDRAQARLIQQQVHRAQSSVNGLRNSLRQSSSPAALLIDKKLTS
ncbi:MAG: histidine kinase dimerization/phospho-acceptor domain-containing protein [Candidatus Acidiferrum sp.]